MKNILYSISVAIIYLSMGACNDPFSNEQLPPATQTGENTFGFKLDGEVWLPYYRGFQFDNRNELSSDYNNMIHGFHLSATREINEDVLRFHFSVSGIDSTYDIFNTQNIVATSDNFSISLNDLSLDGQFKYYDYSIANNTFYIDFSKYSKFEFTKIDTVSNIISGEFEFTITNNEGQELEITEGRFDFNYPYER
jgi:hypothetical protein